MSVKQFTQTVTMRNAPPGASHRTIRNDSAGSGLWLLGGTMLVRAMIERAAAAAGSQGAPPHAAPRLRFRPRQCQRGKPRTVGALPRLVRSSDRAVGLRSLLSDAAKRPQAGSRGVAPDCPMRCARRGVSNSNCLSELLHAHSCHSVRTCFA
jgi:hypothetical protein